MKNNKSARLKVEEVFGNISPKDTIPPEQITKLNIFLAKKM